LRLHPAFIGGRVALARALFDKHHYSEVVQELEKVIQDAPDNIVAQRLMAESFLMLGRVAEALGSYKMLLYFAPQDPDTAKMVQELEAQAYEKGTLVLRTDPQVQFQGDFSVTESQGAIDADPDVKRQRWIRKIEVLQGLLQQVERYKTLNSLRSK
jgi:tetratricopeptide (TPR) repeat protein